jgi:DNA polymerase-4
MAGFCRDCLADAAAADARCRACASPRVARHPRINTLAVAHIDCDAFYAAIEKRDDPTLTNRPLLIGGGKRGVVATACYIARTYGVRSAMPMFKARHLCPDAVVIPPNMAKYVAVGREVRRLMLELTPLVEPLSIDEAFLDLSGTDRLHGQSPARSLAAFAKQVETALGITVSVGLSGNKFLAKIASDLDKPRGFAVLSPDEAPSFLAPKPVGFIWGVGKASEARMRRDGYATIADLQRADEATLIRRYGVEGQRLWRLARGIDTRPVVSEREAKTISGETTFDGDIATYTSLERRLWLMCEKVSARLKAQALAGTTVTLKLKTADFRLRTRARSVNEGICRADDIFTIGRELLRREADGTRYRLLGVGVSNFSAVTDDLGQRDLLETKAHRLADAEPAIDSLRARFGRDAIVRGLAFQTDGEN